MKILVVLTLINLTIKLVSLPEVISNTSDVWNTMLALGIAVVSILAYGVYEGKHKDSKQILRF
jgi:hypothetical protein